MKSEQFIRRKGHKLQDFIIAVREANTKQRRDDHLRRASAAMVPQGKTSPECAAQGNQPNRDAHRTGERGHRGQSGGLAGDE
jgi:hypothetical protein